MYGTQRAYSFYGYSLYEFQVYGKPNLALNKSATSSSNETSTLTADKAVDGNVTTRWASLYSNPQWIYVDLGQETRVNNVKLNWEYAHAKGYKIQVSNDATNWTDIYMTTNGDGGIDDIYFEPVNARYIRMHATDRGTGDWYSLYEFEVYGS
ncbi:Hyaluronoglucosaminidase precursor [compost metagenome]